MTYIKKLVMHGFKSFPRKTELPFTPGINVILGPNGSGKSNISDAFCFVLGRLSIKSMRAAKSKNLIFMGSKAATPAKQASVELIFDNSEHTFSIEKNEISIKRIVRKNGQSIYKINDETKTRQEILSLLAQAGIDPNGFNLILQGEIQNFVRMQSEERRKIIEEVSGISIYESRKAKSLREMEKTEEKLKEVSTTLRERMSYLNNLEKERQHALKYKKLESEIKKFKASIISHNINNKKKNAERVIAEINKKEKDIENLKKEAVKIKGGIKDFGSKIEEINDTIQKSTGIGQEKLNREIADIRAGREGFRVRLENAERKLSEISNQKQEVAESIKENEISIGELHKESPTVAKKEKDLEKKKIELEKLEELRKKFYVTKSELKSVNERSDDKRLLMQNYNNESNFLLKEIDRIGIELYDKKTSIEKINELKGNFEEKNNLLDNLEKRERELEKFIYTYEREIENLNMITENVSKLDICPLCKSQITKEHISSIKEETNPKISSLKKQIQDSNKELNDIYKKKKLIKTDIEQIKIEINKRESDLIKLSSVESKKEQIKLLQEKMDKIKIETSELLKKKKSLEDNFDENLNIEQKYETTLVEVQEISARTKDSVSSEIAFKQRELERLKISLKQLERNKEDLEEESVRIREKLNGLEKELEKKNEQEQELTKKFQRLLAEKNSIQGEIKDKETLLSIKQNNIYGIEQAINEFKIEKARVDAEIENLEIEMLEFPNVEIIKASRENLSSRLNQTQEILSKIGSVNLRSLEVYDSVKEEYDKIEEKVNIITKEKESIIKIIHDIDIKKKKTFLKTLNELNGAFSRNFSQLSVKGQVILDLENKKEPFEGGVSITVKTGHGKYFDVTSLSGGEQTLVALSLIFAIQELRPYYFYILDEIDAALDKRNSERLASLLRKYMRKGQYLVITHNDAVISNATNLYGISMYDGVSKVVSLKL